MAGPYIVSDGKSWHRTSSQYSKSHPWSSFHTWSADRKGNSGCLTLENEVASEICNSQAQLLLQFGKLHKECFSLKGATQNSPQPGIHGSTQECGAIAQPITSKQWGKGKLAGSAPHIRDWPTHCMGPREIRELGLSRSLGLSGTKISLLFIVYWDWVRSICTKS